jgi:putative ABC transport system substrate-binding protein
VHGSTSKALEWLQIIMPDIRQVFVPVGQTSEAAVQSLQDLQKAGRQLGISIISKELKTRGELETVLAKMPRNADAIFALHSVLVLSNMDVVEKIAMEKKVPLVSLHQNREATITYGADGYSAGVQASRLANQIFQGVKPSDMPIELADYYLGINLQKSKEIGMPISSDILLQADKVIR